MLSLVLSLVGISANTFSMEFSGTGKVFLDIKNSPFRSRVFILKSVGRYISKSLFILTSVTRHSRGRVSVLKVSSRRVKSREMRMSELLNLGAYQFLSLSIYSYQQCNNTSTLNTYTCVELALANSAGVSLISIP